MTERDEFIALCKNGMVSGPVSPQEVRRAEKELGVEFPEEYRQFLTEFGSVVADGVQIYGLPSSRANSPPLWQDVVLIAKELRSWRQVGTEESTMLPISDDGTGIYFFLDTTVSPETLIRAVGPGVNKIVSRSLFEFAVKLSNGSLVF